MSEDQCACRIIHQERVDFAREAALTEEVVLSLAQLFKTIGDPSRLRILMALEEQEMCVCDLAALLTISESAVSHQLRLLRTMGFVKNRREGPVLYYSLDAPHIRVLLATALEHTGES